MKSRRFALRVGAVALLLELLVLWRRGYGLGGNVVVRCGQRHLFTTIWIPGVSVKSLRIGWWRFQRCPVGHHWSFVTPVEQAELTEADKLLAREVHDIRIP